jgi:hypothetical protein
MRTPMVMPHGTTSISGSTLSVTLLTGMRSALMDMDAVPWLSVWMVSGASDNLYTPAVSLLKVVVKGKYLIPKRWTEPSVRRISLGKCQRNAAQPAT